MTRIEGLNSCTALKSLWITNCKIQRIEGLEECVQLHSLHLTNNHIAIIEGLDTLSNLEVLWLNENRITSLHGLPEKNRIRSLWLAGNKIEKIGTALDSFSELEELNLANNLVGCFKEILNLNRLSKLKNLCFADPHFGECPVCNLCNYQTYILYHLSQLASLDTMLIGEDSKSLAEATYMKKKMYYNMRIKTLKRNTTNVVRKAQESKQIRTSHVNLNLNVLLRQAKDIQRELESRKWAERGKAKDQDSISLSRSTITCEKDSRRLPGEGNEKSEEANDEKDIVGDSEGEDDLGHLSEEQVHQLKTKYIALQRGIEEKQREIIETKAQFDAFRRRCCEISEQNIARLIVELETGGNIRLEDGKPSDV